MDDVMMVLDGTTEQAKEMDDFFMKKYDISEKDIEEFDLEAFLDISKP